MTGNEMMEQATGTTNVYMQRAVRDIDDLFGKGYARQHPELVAAYMQVAAQDLDTAVRYTVGSKD